MKSNLCKCGCGELCKRDYIKGHFFRVYNKNRKSEDNPSKRPEVKEKIRLSKLGDKNPMKRPEVKAKALANHWSKSSDREIIIKKISKIVKERMSSPDIKKKMEESRKKIDYKQVAEKIKQTFLLKYGSKRITTKCLSCDKIFTHWGNRRFCCKSCASSGKYNTNYGNKYRVLNKLNQSLEFQKKRHKGIKTSPNKPEKFLNSIISKYGFEYCGDGTFLVGLKNPDFVNKKTKKVIEMFGDYWHKENEVEPRKKYFKEYGYETLIIWEHELKEPELKNKIKLWLK